MEELLERLVIAVEQQNSAFPWDSVISILALIASWVTIFFLLKERSEKIALICKYRLNLFAQRWRALF